MEEIKKDSPQHNNQMLMGVLAYVLFLIPLLTGDAKRNEFVKYHTKQGFALFVASIFLVVVGLVLPFLYIIPVIPLLQLGLFILFIIGIIRVANNQKLPLPVIGPLGNWLKI
jgi:uncharacterized membrane protein